MTIHMTHALTLLECFRTALEDNGDAPATICLRHGDQVNPSLGSSTDECCNGLAWVRIVSVEALRTRDDPSVRCLRSERILTLEMGAVRCLPFGTVQAPPTCDQWTSVAILADEDHGAMEAALCCAYNDLSEQGFRTVVAGPYEPTGPDGNCIGGTMRVVVETDCGCTAT